MALRDFDAALNEKLGGRPEFIVGGEKFTARAKIPWKKFSGLILDLTTSGEEEDTAEQQMEKAEKFFKVAIIQADRQRFIDLFNKDDDEDDEDVISLTQINDLMEWLMDYYTGKAEKENLAETPAVSSTPLPSNVVSLNPRVA